MSLCLNTEHGRIKSQRLASSLHSMPGNLPHSQRLPQPLPGWELSSSGCVAQREDWFGSEQTSLLVH